MTSPKEDALGDEHLRALGLGFAGAHRTGKTTLAKKIAENNKVPYISGSLSPLADRLGITVAMDMPFEHRAIFQEAALAQYESAYAEMGRNGLFTTDRTPLDLAAYTLVAWHSQVVDRMWDTWLIDYVKGCFDVANKWLFHIAIVQPTKAIPFVDEHQKGENNDLYRELLNTTMIGLGWDDAVLSSVDVIPRDVVDIKSRVARVTHNYSQQITEYRAVLANRLPMV